MYSYTAVGAYRSGRSTAGIAGSNPTGAWMSVAYACCVLLGRGLRWVDHPVRVLPKVMCLGVI